MFYYKYIDEDNIELMPEYIIKDNMVISNPPLEELFQLDYNKELICEPYPITEEGYYRLQKYKVEGNSIIRYWTAAIKPESSL